MAPKKGLSFDEKRDRLLDLFTETAEFYTLKELEKLAFKRKGIGTSPQSHRLPFLTALFSPSSNFSFALCLPSLSLRSPSNAVCQGRPHQPRRRLHGQLRQMRRPNRLLVSPKRGLPKSTSPHPPSPRRPHHPLTLVLVESGKTRKPPRGRRRQRARLRGPRGKSRGPGRRPRGDGRARSITRRHRRAQRPRRSDGHPARALRRV